jgi:hypothetical protein
MAHLVAVVEEGGVLDLFGALLRAPVLAHVEVLRVVAQPAVAAEHRIIILAGR